MKLKVEYSQIDLKIEEKFFLFSSKAGRLLCFFVVACFSAFAYYLFLQIYDKENLSLINHFYLFVKSFILGLSLALLGYFYVNSGGHVSNHWTSTRKREFDFDFDKKKLTLTDSGRDQDYSFSEISLGEKKGNKFLLISGKGYYLPANVFTSKLLNDLADQLVS